jgi:lysophospholipase L1-like esterase
VTTYVAMGDSFTAGFVPGQPRWPDALAHALGPHVRYENLASVGATSEKVESEQLERAIELEPDLVTLVCGANDVLESTRPDSRAYAERLGRMFRRLRRETPDATIVSATYPDISRFLDLRPRSRARVEKGMERFNAAARAVAQAHGVVLLEGFDHPAAEERSTFAEDGFHPSEEGHRKAAYEFLRALKDRAHRARGPFRRAPRRATSP